MPVVRARSLAGIWSSLEPEPYRWKPKKKNDRRFTIVEGVLMDTSHHTDCPSYLPHEPRCKG